MQVANTAEGLLKLGELALLQKQLLLGVALGGVFVVDFFEFFHATETLGDGLEVGQQTTQPALVDVGLPHAGCLLRNRFLRLLLGTNEQDGASVGNGVLDEVVGLVNVGKRLLQVDDVNTAALGENEPLYFRVPPASLVSEVNTAIE